jgi:hypothetical protein
MVSKAVIITSCIEVNNIYPLTYSKTRSAFSNEERWRQTITSVAAIDIAMGRENTIIYLIDASENYQQYKDTLKYQTNLRFISIKEEFPEIFDIVRCHPNKTFCECTILKNFITKYKEELAEQDFIFKFSGRYFLDSSFNINHIIPYNNNTIFFKYPMVHEWQDWWGYQMVDQRSQQGDNKLKQYSTVLFGFGNQQISNILDIIGKIVDLLSNQKMLHYDMETLIYYYTRSLKNHIIETDWVVYGFHGADGRFVRY